ncbi:MAG: CAP domain-containing protein [Hyphomicrobium sp.]
MAAFTVYEQLLLELMNRARLDPVGEAARLGISLNAGLAPGTISTATKQALAPNNELVTAARAHSQHMINVDLFDHENIGDGTPTSRMTAAGYALTGSWMTGENIAWTGTTGVADVLAFTIEIADNLFLSAGHRVNTLNESFREAGTGIVAGAFTDTGTTYNAVMATENFGLSGSSVFVSGVAINDADGDNFYDVGEARANVNVAVSTNAIADGNDVTEAAGGYSVATATGTHVVTFSGGGLASPVTVAVAGGGSNVKVDLSGTNEILSSVTTILGSGAKDLVLLGAVVANGTGNALANVMIGSKGNNILDGGTGNDTLTGGAGNDTYYLDSALDVVNEAVGTGTQDTIVSSVAVRLDTTTTAQGVEHVSLLGSNGVSVVGTSTFNAITGNSGANYLAGYGGNDTVSGGGSADRILGGDGKDTLTGGAGDDSFLYAFIADSGGTQARRDVITDFSQIAGNNDWIDLALTDANGALGGNQTFAFISTAAFSGAAGELRYFQDVANNRTIIEGNVRIDAASAGAEFSIELTGLKTLTGGGNNSFDIIL